jgi:hypothetical protein
VLLSSFALEKCEEVQLHQATWRERNVLCYILPPIGCLVLFERSPGKALSQLLLEVYSAI